MKTTQEEERTMANKFEVFHFEELFWMTWIVKLSTFYVFEWILNEHDFKWQGKGVSQTTIVVILSPFNFSVICGPLDLERSWQL